MQSRNIKSIRWAGVMVILLAFFVCLGLKGETHIISKGHHPSGH
jgi:hypothetical protein